MNRAVSKSQLSPSSKAKSLSTKQVKAALSKGHKASVLSDTDKVALSLDNLVAQAERGEMKIHTLPKEANTPDQILAYLKSV